MSLEPIVMGLYERNEKLIAISVLNAYAKNAFSFEEYDDLSKCFFKIKEYESAIEYGEKTLINSFTNERMWVARSNLINVYNHANYPEKALRLIRANEAVIPDDTDTRLEKAFSHFLLNEWDVAEAILRAELEMSDITEDVRTKILFNLGIYELYRDNFQVGLKLFLKHGSELKIWKTPVFNAKRWDGLIQPGKTIVIFAEAGIGDEIINVRFMKRISDVGMNPIWFTERNDLSNIFANSGFHVLTDKRNLPKDAMWTTSMHLPINLNLGYKDLWYGPYIKTLPSFDEKWKHINDSNELKIGIRWQGNPDYDHDRHRSVKLNSIVKALPNDAELYSLQRDTGLDELYDFPQIKNLSARLKSFEDTLSVINNLDIIVTTCTSVAHAAAALGKRTFVFVPISSYYVWSHSTKQSPWYGDNVTLLRQTKPRNWDEPLAELKRLINNDTRA